jgi:hypothetical protein
MGKRIHTPDRGTLPRSVDTVDVKTGVLLVLFNEDVS